MLIRNLQKIIKNISEYKTSLTLMQNNQKQEYIKRLEQNVLIEYKKYPALPHQDPLSKEYIHSQLDQYHDKTQVQAYNSVIDQFKHDLKIQKEVWNAIDNLDRPYKQGIRGIDRNLDVDGGYKQTEMQDIGFKRKPSDVHDVFIKNEDRFIANTPFIMKQKYKHQIEWQKERLNRPVTKNYNHNKGYKYDVPLKQQQKYEFMADRLGHPQFLGTPVDRLLKLQNDIFHPVYLDQPFVKIPSSKPDINLNFQQGQVLYQNTKVLQWLKFWQISVFTGSAFFGVYLPTTILFKTNLVTDAADQIALTMKYHLVTPCSVDILKAGIPLGAGLIAYTVYILLNYTNAITNQYVVKMTYSKDKQLLFVKRIDLHGQLYEQVYEVAHLQILPPNQRSSLKYFSSQDQNGLWRISCLNTQKQLLVYNDNNHWNHQLQKEFFKRILGLWDKSYYGYTRQQQQLMQPYYSTTKTKQFQSLPKQ